MLPNTLTDRELVSFADRYISTSGLPSDFQRELLHRYEALLNKIDDCELIDAEADNEVFEDLRREVDRLELENAELQNQLEAK